METTLAPGIMSVVFLMIPVGIAIYLLYLIIKSLKIYIKKNS